MITEVNLFEELSEGEEKKNLTSKEITALLLYRYHLSLSNKNEQYKTKNMALFKKVSSFILDNDLDDHDLPNKYDTHDNSLIKIIVRDLNGKYNKSKRINHRKRYT